MQHNILTAGVEASPLRLLSFSVEGAYILYHQFIASTSILTTEFNYSYQSIYRVQLIISIRRCSHIYYYEVFLQGNSIQICDEGTNIRGK